MDLFLIALLLAAVGAVVVVALGRVGGGLAPVQPDAVPPLDGPVSAPTDLDRARFGLALRGYRMDQVDAVLDEARDLLVHRDEEIARLRQLLPVQSHPVEPRTSATATKTSVEPEPDVEPDPRVEPDLSRPSDPRS